MNFGIQNGYGGPSFYSHPVPNVFYEKTVGSSYDGSTFINYLSLHPGTETGTLYNNTTDWTTVLSYNGSGLVYFLGAYPVIPVTTGNTYNDYRVFQDDVLIYKSTLNLIASDFNSGTGANHQTSSYIIGNQFYNYEPSVGGNSGIMFLPDTLPLPFNSSIRVQARTSTLTTAIGSSGATITCMWMLRRLS